MKKFAIAALLSAQMLASAQPAMAAELAEVRDQQVGTFAGVRLRVPLDGNVRQRPIRAGLTVAPTLRSTTLGGEVRTRFGEGLELGIEGDEPVRLRLAGTRIDRLGVRPDGPAPEGRRAGVSTLGWVAIGVGAAIIIGGVLAVDYINDQSE